VLFSRNWLRDYVDLPASVSELVDGLTAVGLAVEGVEEVKGAGDDVLLDVDVTTNRPDCMNHLGLAREVAVRWGVELRPPRPEPVEAAEATADAVSVELADAEGCPRYVARVVRGVTVGESPRWLKQRLKALGLRPINNVVDVTNYVLWESGQPLHGFDLAKIRGKRIIVRRAAAGEKLTTLDGEERKLTPEVLVIADAAGAVALAGIMGGLDSEVTGSTTDVLLESAHFDRRRVRLGARELGMHTDASHRFERGADPGACLDAANRAAALLAELAGGEVLAGAVDRRADGFAGSFTARGRLDHGRLQGFAGIEIDADRVEGWMRGLGFELRRVDGPEPAGSDLPVWEVTAPTWRWYDMEPGPDGGIYEQDLFEEVLRLHGFDAIPATLPAIAGSDGTLTAEQVRRDRIRDHLAACGYAEAINYAFQSRDMDATLPRLTPDGSPPVDLANPLSELYSVLRRSLVPNLAANARFNARRGVEAVRLFEVGHVFWHGAAGEAGGKEAGGKTGGVGEEEAVAVLCGGVLGMPWDRPTELDLFDLKGVLETLGEVLETPLAVRPAEELPGVVAGTAAEVLVDGRAVGWMGRLEDDEAGYPLYAAELFTAPLGTGVLGGAAEMQVRVPSRFPTVAVDLTLTHAAATPWADLAAVVEEHRPEALAGYGLKDRYTGEGVPAGAVNSTLWFLYSHPGRTLTQDEVNQHQQALTAELERRFACKG